MGLNLALMGLLGFLSGTAPPSPEVFERVRSASPRILMAIEEGSSRSPTFRDLVHRVRAADVIVHLESGTCACRRARSCLTFVTSSGGVRYLRVVVNVRQPGRDLISQIAHELRHAVEIAEAAEVTSVAAFAHFYATLAGSGCFVRNCYETRGALASEAAVRRELSGRVRGADGK